MLLAGLAARHARLNSAPSDYIWLDADDGGSSGPSTSRRNESSRLDPQTQERLSE
jgi:hypothetical protein